MSILVDPQSEEVQVTLNQEAEQAEPQQEEVQPENEGFVMPDKFKEKSAEEIAQSYLELEKAYGQRSNELGEYRNLTDRILTLEEKRQSDLGGNAPQDFQIDPTELLADPNKVLEDFYEHRRSQDPAYAQLQERLDRIEGQVTQTHLEKAHPDAAQLAGSPEFQSWVRSSPYRVRIAQNAVQAQDVEALDYLLTEYKSGKASNQTQNSNVSRAAAVSTESSTSGSPITSAKRFSRRELINMKISDPEQYRAREKEIFAAYAEGRVDD